MSKKNVMVILCDQFRPDFISCYNEKSPVKTPNIDSLAQNGLLMQHAVTASPVCAPGRACMMTGRYVSDHGVWTNDVPFRDGIEFLGERMSSLGYACGAFGKLHHFPAKDSKGFEIAWQMEENRLGDEDDYFKYLKNVHSDAKGVFNADENGIFLYSPEEYYETQIANHAIDYIEKNKVERNFFTWVSFQGPHTPMDPPNIEYNFNDEDMYEPVNPEFNPPCEVARYRKSRGDTKSNGSQMLYRIAYAKMIEFIDIQVGRLINYLKENGLYENTTIIFSTDHGDLCGDYAMRQKGPFIYSAQLEVPLIVSNHPNLPRNVKTDMLSGNLDIASTVLALADDNRPLAHSRDISKMYNNKDYQREEVYSEFADSMRLISTKEYRCAYYPFTGETELVKINDEMTNLANLPEYQELKAKFLCTIIDYLTISKGVAIEAQDFTPKVQEGLGKKFPEWKDEVQLVFPISNMEQIEALKRDGLSTTYNEFCKDREIQRFYGLYWNEGFRKNS